ncbi:hypothetical protein Tcan_17842 [Toxocara canis]|uniref:Uncharacterized protein n=1 Tax=Toxocara canis TaxID=6265 RepID=A0A0B2VYQ5_TOXCA|nr:hypothetical protein Tcan_17842 [Toxocara canis]
MEKGKMNESGNASSDKEQKAPATNGEADSCKEYKEISGEGSSVGEILLQLHRNFAADPTRTVTWLMNDIERIKQQNADGLKEIAEDLATIRDLEKQADYADIVFRTQYEYRQERRATVEETPRVLDLFKVNAKVEDTELKSDGPNVSGYIWERLQEWRRLLSQAAWMKKYHEEKCALKLAQRNMERMLCAFSALQSDVGHLEKICTMDEQQLMKLRERISRLTGGEAQPSTSRDGTSSYGCCGCSGASSSSVLSEVLKPKNLEFRPPRMEHWTRQLSMISLPTNVDILVQTPCLLVCLK